MIRRVVKATNGKEVTLFTPETEEDIKELERLEAAGRLDSAQSLADFHGELPDEEEAAPAEERKAA